MKDIKETKTDYKPEIIIAIASNIAYIITFLGVTFGVVKLYELSSSWHSLWLLLIMLFSNSVKFTRD